MKQKLFMLSVWLSRRLAAKTSIIAHDALVKLINDSKLVLFLSLTLHTDARCTSISNSNQIKLKSKPNSFMAPPNMINGISKYIYNFIHNVIHLSEFVFALSEIVLCLEFILLSKTQRMYMQQQIKTDHNNLSDQLAGKNILLLQFSVDLGYTYVLS